jgi:gliding motility-associated-like protein
MLTIGPALITLSIPNTFTPNGDGINDTWVIGALDYYPGCTVNIFNRWGRKLFSSIGYAIPWDGKYNGANLTSGTYYYVIDPRNGKTVISGWVTIIR